MSLVWVTLESDNVPLKARLTDLAWLWLFYSMWKVHNLGFWQGKERVSWIVCCAFVATWSSEVVLCRILKRDLQCIYDLSIAPDWILEGLEYPTSALCNTDLRSKFSQKNCSGSQVARYNEIEHEFQYKHPCISLKIHFTDFPLHLKLWLPTCCRNSHAYELITVDFVSDNISLGILL